MSARVGLFSIALFTAGRIVLADEVVPPAEPLPTGIVERSSRRLIQIDASATGPADILAGLTREDFRLVIAGRPIKEFTVDRLCDPQPVPGRLDSASAANETADPNPTARVGAAPTIAFYFDQHRMTMPGRARAFELARQLIPDLVRDGARGLVVSNGDELRTFCDLTSETDRLLDSLGEIDKDRKQWNLLAFEEDRRVLDVEDRIRRGEVDRAKRLARQYQQEERWVSDKAMRRLAMVIARLTELDSPKVLIYFADTMRSNPGDHYISFFKSELQGPPGDLEAMAIDSLSGASAFEQVVAQAALSGVRVYAVQAGGLVTERRRRVTDAQDTLVRMALETGGRSFLNGIGATKISGAVTDDLSCLFLISFDPDGLREDSPLGILLEVTKPGVRLHARGNLVVGSEQVKLTNRLLAAFTAPDTASENSALRAHLIPLGFVDGRYRALVQLVPAPSPLNDATWDLGFSVIARGRVRQDAAGRIDVSAARTPVVFESEISLKPGPYEIVAVAHETQEDRISTFRLEGELVEPDEQPLLIGPTILLQPAAAIFSRSGELRRTGPLAIGNEQVARLEIPTAFVTLVCAARAPRGEQARIQRRLVGETIADYEPIALPVDRDEPCMVIRDVVPRGKMTRGGFRYEIEIVSGANRLANSFLEFRVDEALPGAASTPTVGS